MSSSSFRHLSAEQWIGQAHQLYGDDKMCWRFVCPICGHVQSVRDYRDAGAPEGAVGTECVGRWIDGSRRAFGDTDNNARPGPCNYTGFGLLRLNPVIVTDEEDGREHRFFEFASLQEQT